MWGGGVSTEAGLVPAYAGAAFSWMYSIQMNNNPVSPKLDISENHEVNPKPEKNLVVPDTMQHSI